MFAEQYASLGNTVLSWLNLGTVTIPQLTHVPAAVLLAILVAGAFVLFRRIEMWERR